MIVKFEVKIETDSDDLVYLNDMAHTIHLVLESEFEVRVVEVKPLKESINR